MKTMTNKQFLNHYGLELSLPTKEAVALRKILKQATESFAVEYTEKKSIKVGNLQFYDFQIFCEKTNFANAYFHIGRLYAENVLPVRKERFNKKSVKKQKPKTGKCPCKNPDDHNEAWCEGCERKQAIEFAEKFIVAIQQKSEIQKQIQSGKSLKEIEKIFGIKFINPLSKEAQKELSNGKK